MQEIAIIESRKLFQFKGIFTYIVILGVSYQKMFQGGTYKNI